LPSTATTSLAYCEIVVERDRARKTLGSLFSAINKNEMADRGHGCFAQEQRITISN
jgi:hypothetical protein